MSLCCVQCDQDMGPSDSLPGRDGVMISPVLPTLVWGKKKENETQKFFVRPVHATAQRSLCFHCIKEKISDSQQFHLAMIFNAIMAETAYLECEQKQKGKWMSGDDRSKLNLWDEYKTVVGGIPITCLLCGKDPHKLLHFCASSFDRVFCRQFKAGLFRDENYSITNPLPCGMTGFKMCFSCVQECFPRLCMALGSDLGGIDDLPSDSQFRNEIYLHDSFVAALRQEDSLEAENALQKLKDLGAKIIGPSQN